jgi:hypothetical protein
VFAEHPQLHASTTGLPTHRGTLRPVMSVPPSVLAVAAAYTFDAAVYCLSVFINHVIEALLVALYAAMPLG